MSSTDEICKRCANRQNFDGMDRCARYNDSLCEQVFKFCVGKFFLDVDRGISLYALKRWIDRLSRDEMEVPLVCEDHGRRLIPFFMMRKWSVSDDRWVFYLKGEDDVQTDEQDYE